MYRIILLCSFLVASNYSQNEPTNKKSNLIFSHAFHSDSGSECIDCHPAEDSKVPQDDLLPKMEYCYLCHNLNEACDVCHANTENVVKSPRIKTYIAKFSHKIHSKQGHDCKKCHARINDDAFNSILPTMKSCRNCHPKTASEPDCSYCHSAAWIPRSNANRSSAVIIAQ